MRALVTLVVVLAACGGGGGKQAATAGQPATPEPTVSELRRRQDAACEAAGPRLTDCAVADALATMTPEQLEKEHMVGEGLAYKKSENTKNFVAKCKRDDLSSRQVRVYEVCMHAETACDPYIDCLGHLNDHVSE